MKQFVLNILSRIISTKFLMKLLLYKIYKDNGVFRHNVVINYIKLYNEMFLNEML